MSPLCGFWRLLASLLALVPVLAASLFSAVPASAAAVTSASSPTPTCSSSFATAVLAPQPENRVKGLLPAGPPRIGVSRSVSPEGARGFDLFLRFSTSGVTVYVNGDPVNLSDPSGHFADDGTGQYGVWHGRVVGDQSRSWNTAAQQYEGTIGYMAPSPKAYVVQPGLPALPPAAPAAVAYYITASQNSQYCSEFPDSGGCLPATCVFVGCLTTWVEEHLVPDYVTVSGGYGIPLPISAPIPGVSAGLQITITRDGTAYGGWHAGPGTAGFSTFLGAGYIDGGPTTPADRRAFVGGWGADLHAQGGIPELDGLGPGYSRVWGTPFQGGPHAWGNEFGVGFNTSVSASAEYNWMLNHPGSQ